MLERVLKTISRYNMLPAGVRVIVAVSGGADSVCLFHALRDLGVAVAAVAHFNHKLRGEASDDDEQFVASLAADLPFYRAESRIADLPGNLEQNARDARNAFFATLTDENTRIALAHTRNDQAETVLFRILRGSGLTGLAGIHPVTTEGIIRPLIEIGRCDVEDYLRSRNLPWREDITNGDLGFARNRIRHELLPQLAREWNPRIVESLAKLADVAYEEQAGTGHSRRLIRTAIASVKGDLRGIEFNHIERILDLAAQPGGYGGLSLPGVEVTRSFDSMRFAATPAATFDPVEVTVPGTYQLPSGGEIRFEVDSGIRANLKSELPWQRIPALLVLPGWRPGDHYRPVGESRDQKIKEMFQRTRVPSWRRPSWPILSSGEKILWARHFGAAAEFAAGFDEASGPVLRIVESEGVAQ